VQKSAIDEIYKLDTFNLEQGWSSVKLKTPYEPGCQYGVLPLSDMRDYAGRDTSTLIFFGGLNNMADKLRQTVLVTLDNNNLDNSTLSVLKPIEGQPVDGKLIEDKEGKSNEKPKENQPEESKQSKSEAPKSGE